MIRCIAWICVVVVGCLASIYGAQAAGLTHSQTAEFVKPAQQYLVGAPMPMYYTTERLESVRPLLMDHKGIRRYLALQLKDAQGQVVPGPRNPLRIDIHELELESFHEMPPIYPNEPILLGVDLARLFDIKSAGKYTLTLWRGNLQGEKIDEIIIDVFEFAEIEDDNVLPRLHLEEICASSRFSPRDTGTLDGVRVECTVCAGWGYIEGNGAANFLRIQQQVSWGPEANVGPTVAFPIRAARLIQAELDYLWQVWMILESEENGKRTLMVADLQNGTMRTLVPWGPRQDVSLGWTRARKGMQMKLVYGGKIGETQFSTYTVSQSGGWRNPYEPPPITEQTASEEASPNHSTPTIEPAETTAP